MRHHTSSDVGARQLARFLIATMVGSALTQPPIRYFRRTSGAFGRSAHGIGACRRRRCEATPLEDVVRALGYRHDPGDDARWRHLESVVSINGFMFYDHLCGEWGAGAVDLVVHVHRCFVPDALTFLSELRGHSRRAAHRLCRRAPSPLKPARSQRQWPAVQRYLVDQRGLSPVLIALCCDLGLLYADR